jgi:type VI secretion system secreted protein Hcp
MAQGDYFLKLEGIDGESVDDKHKNEIQVASISFGVANAGSGGSNTGSGSGKASVQDMHFTKQVDKSSPGLFITCCSGKHIPTATITLRKAGDKPHEYLVYKLFEVFVSSINTTAHDGGGIASESLSLNFSKIEMTYTPQKADGSADAKVTKTYDVAKNKVS